MIYPPVCDFAKFWTERFFYFWTPHFNRLDSTFWLDCTLILYYDHHHYRLINNIIASTRLRLWMPWCTEKNEAPLQILKFKQN